MTGAIPIGRTFSDVVDEQVSSNRAALAIVDRGERVSYADLSLRARKAAAFLLSLEIARGDRIAILIDNRREWIEVCIAASYIGATLVPFSTFATATELDFLLNDSGARVLITVDRLGDREMRAELASLGRLLDEIVVIGTPGRGQRGYAEVASFAPLQPLPPGLRASPTDDALILYTSGSSSRPKAVRLQHYALIENGFNIGERQGLGVHDRVFVTQPLFWAYGSANALPAVLTHGASIILQRRFDAAEALALIEGERCTAIYTLPTITSALTSHPGFDKQRVASLRTGLTIGSPQQVADVIDSLGVAGICNIYGMSETCGNCCVTAHDDPVAMRITSQGLPLPGVTVRIADPQTGDALAAGEIGAIEVKGYLFAGYAGAGAERNAAAFTPDGYFRTGDSGALTPEGRLVFAGRDDDMIKRGGINVSPSEVEDMLLQHHDIDEALVVGVPDARLGAAIVAFIVPADSASLTAAALTEYCRSRASKYKVPDHFILRDTLPTTATGKATRRSLRDAAMAALSAFAS